MSNRESARDFLAAANDPLTPSDRQVATALIGIGFSLLEVADVVRDNIDSQISMKDFEAWYWRAAAAANPGAVVAERTAEHAAPEPSDEP